MRTIHQTLLLATAGAVAAALAVHGVSRLSAADVAPPPTPATPAKSAPSFTPRGNLSIDADGGFTYDGETGRVIYKTKVKVLDPAEDPRTIILCDWLTTVLPPPGGKVGEIIALTNVIIQIKDEKGMQVATGSKAVFNTTNETVTITGNPVVEMHTGTLYGDQEIIYRRVSNRFEAPGRIRMVARTNAPAGVLGFGGTNKTVVPSVPKP